VEFYILQNAAKYFVRYFFNVPVVALDIILTCFIYRWYKNLLSSSW